MATRFKKTRKNTRRASRKALRVAKKRTMKRGGGILEALGLKKPVLTGAPTNGNKENATFQYNMPTKLIEDPKMQMNSTLVKLQKYGRNVRKEEQKKKRYYELEDKRYNTLINYNKNAFINVSQEMDTVMGKPTRTRENYGKDYEDMLTRVRRNTMTSDPGTLGRPSNVSTIASEPREIMNSNNNNTSGFFGGKRKNRTMKGGIFNFLKRTSPFTAPTEGEIASNNIISENLPVQNSAKLNYQKAKNLEKKIYSAAREGNEQEFIKARRGLNAIGVKYGLVDGIKSDNIYSGKFHQVRKELGINTGLNNNASTIASEGNANRSSSPMSLFGGTRKNRK